MFLSCFSTDVIYPVLSLKIASNPPGLLVSVMAIFPLHSLLLPSVPQSHQSTTYPGGETRTLAPHKTYYSCQTFPGVSSVSLHFFLPLNLGSFHHYNEGRGEEIGPEFLEGGLVRPHP